MLVEIRACRDCGNQFESAFSRGAWAGRCPSCADIAQRRPSVVIERVSLFGPILCVIDSLPGDWREYTGQKGDQASYRINAKGRMYGASWSGRIDIFSRRPLEPGAIARFEELEAIHRVKVQELRRTRNDFASGTTIDYIKRLRQHVHYGDGKEELERHRYVRLSPIAPEQEHVTDAETLPRLVFVAARTKMTIKGFGRQYSNELRGAPLWERRMQGVVRSGRAYTDAALALVDEEHPLETVNLFDR